MSRSDGVRADKNKFVEATIWSLDFMGTLNILLTKITYKMYTKQKTLMEILYEIAGGLSNIKNGRNDENVRRT